MPSSISVLIFSTASFHVSASTGAFPVLSSCKSDASFLYCIALNVFPVPQQGLGRLQLQVPNVQFVSQVLSPRLSVCLAPPWSIRGRHDVPLCIIPCVQWDFDAGEGHVCCCIARCDGCVLFLFLLYHPPLQLLLAFLPSAACCFRQWSERIGAVAPIRAVALVVLGPSLISLLVASVRGKKSVPGYSLVVGYKPNMSMIYNK